MIWGVDIAADIQRAHIC